MAHTLHAVQTADQRAERRAARKPRPTVRRQSTRTAVVLAALAEHDDAPSSLDDLGLTYPNWS